MDAPTARHPRQNPARIAVQLSDPGEVAASVPHLLGFRPRESVVAISLTGPSGHRVGLTARADIPPKAHAAAVAAMLVRSLRSDHARGVLLVVVSDVDDDHSELPAALSHRGLVREVAAAFTAADILVRDALLVREGRWWSYDCPHRCCAPEAGTLLPEGVSELEVAAVATGNVVEPDRAALGRRIAPPADPAGRDAMAAICIGVARESVDRMLSAGKEAASAQSWAVVKAALARCRPGAPGARERLSDREIAGIVCGVRDPVVRDRALTLALGGDADAAEQLWTECTRRAPMPLDVVPATLLAVSTWLRGDGAMADVALSRALAGDPGYALARLLREALAVCVPPSELRALLQQAARAPAGPPDRHDCAN